PSGSALGGFTLDVLGIRGVEDAPGVYPNLAVYANLGFDPSLVPALSVAAETEASVVEIKMPAASEFSVTNPSGPKTPAVVLALSGNAPRGESPEYQIRVDGSLWTPFFSQHGSTVPLSRPEFAAQGHHRIEVRARIENQ